MRIKEPMMTRPIALFVLVATALLCGCASTPQQPPMTSYTKAGATQEQFMKDRSECIQQAQHQAAAAYGAVSTGTTFIKCDAVPSCLTNRGYAVNAKGNLAAPPGTDVACVN
jgi:hypothetical protein